MEVKYKIYGERNSGNNYLIKLCEKNLGIHIETNSYDWMHGYANRRDEYKYLVTVRNPYSWALSMWEDPHSEEKPNKYFNKFLRQQFEMHTDIIKMWNLKYLSYLKLGLESESVGVRFEDLLKNPEKEIREIAKLFGLKMKHFENIENEVRSGGTILENKYDRRDYYLKEEWRKRISSKDMNYMKSKFNHDLLNIFKYE